MLRLTLACIAVCFLLGSAAISSAEQATVCQEKSCQEECRVKETCDESGSCSFEAVCVSPGDRYPDYGCIVGKPLLTAGANDSIVLRTCHPANPCPDNFYCSTALMDAAARCCPAAPTSSKEGQCRAPIDWDSFFCVDKCLSDADCHGRYKCCQTSTSCAKKRCSPPV